MEDPDDAPFLAVLFLVFASYTSQAQEIPAEACQLTEQLRQTLKEGYREVQRWYGVTNTGALLEIYESEKDRTWSLLLTLPDGGSCLIAAGVDPERIDDGDPTF